MVDTPAPPRRSLRRPFVISVLGAVAVIGMVIAFTGPSGDQSPKKPAAVELVYPDGGDLDLRQVAVVADLAPGYEGYLVIDGERVPDDQVRWVAPLNQLTLQPDDTGEFELDAGLHRVAVAYWHISQSEAEAQFYRWSFRLH